MKPPGCRKTHSRHVGAFEDDKMGKARERVETMKLVRDVLSNEALRRAHAIIQKASKRECVVCGSGDATVGLVLPGQGIAFGCQACVDDGRIALLDPETVEPEKKARR